jgi:hypothetical protein
MTLFNLFRTAATAFQLRNLILFVRSLKVTIMSDELTGLSSDKN